MQKLYIKNELLFAVAVIAISYLPMILLTALYSVALLTEPSINAHGIATAALSLMVPYLFPCLVAFELYGFAKKNGLKAYHGLRRVERGGAKECLYFLPLALIALCNLAGGIQLNVRAIEIATKFIGTLIGAIVYVLIFCGFLFRATYARKRQGGAIIFALIMGLASSLILIVVSPITFVISALSTTALLHLFAVLFIRTGSLAPAIIGYVAINTLQLFAVTDNVWFLVGEYVAATLIAFMYAAYLNKHVPARIQPDDNAGLHRLYAERYLNRAQEPGATDDTE